MKNYRSTSRYRKKLFNINCLFIDSYEIIILIRYKIYNFSHYAGDYLINILDWSEQAINLVRLYDGSYPENFVELYLDYYQMSSTEFDSVIDKWVNPDLFKKENGRWKPTFTIK